MGMLSNRAIENEIRNGNILITPFNQNHLGTNSYDVRLGEWICRQREDHGLPIRYNYKEGADLMWQKPKKIDPSVGLILMPGETVLAHTEEYIGGANFITSEMRAKSTSGRFCLEVCKCAGIGDVGYQSRWTMEMTNNSRHILVLEIGDRVAQILFHNVGQVTSTYGKLTGRYGQGEWAPEDMLPKGQK